jgi:hypothetical protein
MLTSSSGTSNTVLNDRITKGVNAGEVFDIDQMEFILKEENAKLKNPYPKEVVRKKSECAPKIMVPN